MGKKILKILIVLAILVQAIICGLLFNFVKLLSIM